MMTERESCFDPALPFYRPTHISSVKLIRDKTIGH